MEPLSYGDERIPERIWAKIQVAGSGCWIWQGATGGSSTHRYGVAVLDGKLRLVHRHMYHVFVAPLEFIPGQRTESHVHHECRVTRCVNPDHLKLLSVAEHIGQWHRDKTHCPAGHPYAEHEYERPTGARDCRKCAGLRAKEKRNAERAVVGLPPAIPQAERTHCPSGHPYDEENTYMHPEGYRSCRECSRQRVRARRAAGKR